MAEQYKIVMTLVVQKGETSIDKVEEAFYFAAASFAKMVPIANDFYELIAKLQKVK